MIENIEITLRIILIKNLCIYSLLKNITLYNIINNITNKNIILNITLNTIFEFHLLYKLL